MCFMQPVTKLPASHETISLTHKDFLTVHWTLLDCCAHLCCVNPSDVLLLLISLRSVVPDVFFCWFFCLFFSCTSESPFYNVTSCLCDGPWCGLCAFFIHNINMSWGSFTGLEWFSSKLSEQISLSTHFYFSK